MANAMRIVSVSLLLALLVTGCAEPPPAGDVILVTVDTLRADHLGIYGYPRSTSPRIDAWFAGGRIYQRAYSTSASTSPSVVSILTGLHPREHAVRHFYQLVPEATAILPQLLPPQYTTAGFISNAVLADEALGIAARFDHYDDFVSDVVPVPGAGPIVERDARATTDAVLSWLAERTPEEPLFLWVHYMDPHGPYDPPEQWRSRFGHEGSRSIEPSRIQPYQRLEGVDDALDYVDRYDEEIAYADAQIGRLLDGHAALRDPTRSLYVFTADHGEVMLERLEWFRHGYHVFEEIVRVPLLLRGPGVEPGRVPDAVSLVDVAPTILAFAGAEAPDAPHVLDSIDLRTDTSPGSRPIFFEATSHLGQKRAVVAGDEKWIASVDNGASKPRRRWRFDLAADAVEKKPMKWSAMSYPAEQLLERIRTDPDPGGQPMSAERYREGVRLGAPKLPEGFDPAAAERLRALGYLADDEEP
jgi:arylsulfatase A-like enzyme